MELIFKIFEDPRTLLKIKIPKYALYIGIDIRRILFFENIKCINFFTQKNFRLYSITDVRYHVVCKD